VSFSTAPIMSSPVLGGIMNVKAKQKREPKLPLLV
jgi:hypothetical protein